MIIFSSFGINWQLIFGEEITGAAHFSAAAIARVCGAASLWLWFCAAMFVQSLGDAAANVQVNEDVVGSEGAYIWATVASASIVGLPIMILLLPLPTLAWRTRVAWLKLFCKMAVVPFVEVLAYESFVFRCECDSVAGVMGNVFHRRPVMLAQSRYCRHDDGCLSIKKQLGSIIFAGQ